MSDESHPPEWAFCGNRTFVEHSTQSEASSWFDVWEYSSCATDTIAVGVPTLVMVLVAAVRIIQISSVPKRNNVTSSRIFIAKQTTNVLLCLLETAQLVDAVWNGKYTYQIVGPAEILFGFVLALAVMQMEHDRGIRISRGLGIFWSLTFVVACFRMYLNVMQLTNKSLDDKITIRSGIFFGQFGLSLLMVALSNMAEPALLYQGKKPCPETSAGLLSIITFSWLNGLMALGFRRPLEDKDLWGLNPDDQAPVLSRKFQRSWDEEVTRKRSRNAEPSLLRALSRSFGTTLYVAGLFKLIQDSLAFLQPELLKLLIRYIQDRNNPNPEDVPPKSTGWELACAMFAVALIQSMALHQYFHRVYVTGMRLRSAVITSVYDKSLKLSSASRQSSTSGEIVNLMAIDAQRFMDVVTYIHMLWSAPYQISLSLYFLYKLMGPSIFAGLGVMILMIPINGMIASKERAISRKLMRKKDGRIREMTELLNGMKVLKLYAWETAFSKKIKGLRTEELLLLRRAAIWRACSTFSWTSAPFLVSLVTFAVYTKALGNELTPETAFVALALFNLLRFPLVMLPMLITSIVQAQVSVSRLTEFMLLAETNPDNVVRKRLPTARHELSDMDMVSVHQGMFAWALDGFHTPPVLKNINFSVKAQQVCAFVGPVGCGKSSLMSALLGDMEKMQGTVTITGSVAYVPQQAWIQNATLRDNVLFHQPFDPVRYQTVLEACALVQDLSILPAGDLTEIGEKGINLSGGQKQRVSLARAVYADAQVYILDDPLSAVDSHVGQHIFDKVVGPNGLLKNASRLFVTHAIQYVPSCDQVVCLRDGTIQEQGSYSELMEQKGAFAAFIDEYLTSHKDDDDIDMDELKEQLSTSLDASSRTSSHSVANGNDESRTSSQRSEPLVSTVNDGADDDAVDGRDNSYSLNVPTESPARKGKKSRKGTSAEKQPLLGKQEGESGKKKKDKAALIDKETTQKGEVLAEVYRKYFQAIGYDVGSLVMVFYGLAYAANIGTNYWLKVWSEPPTDATDTTEAPPLLRDGVGANTSLDVYLGVYAALGFGYATLMFFAAITLAFGAIAAANKLHTRMLDKVMRAPMSWFDTTPMGRIVNRFSQDVYTIDEMIPRTLSSFLSCLFQVLATVVVVSISSYFFLAAVVPLAIMFYLIQRYYVRTSRQLKRLESVSRSPIYAHFSETLSGVSSIRAYDKSVLFVNENENKVDYNLQAYYPSVSSNRWLAMRLEFLGSCIIFFTAMFAIIEDTNIDASSVGLSITYAMSVTQTLNWMVRMATELETNIVAVERVDEYCKIDVELPAQLPNRPDATWPTRGEVALNNYACRYRQGLDLVLKGITATIRQGEKVGVVGRTGAGKSSLMLALFRLVEPARGTIKIDGIDITKVGLDDLRKKITIMPQDAVLFAGTVRDNVDPLGAYSTKMIWDALETAHLKDFVVGLGGGLESAVAEGGENFSVGQRQLLCLARAVLRKTRVLILDEATAACDMETDEKIQQTIRTVFADCTVLTIAHRLNTIMDSTRVLVLDEGCIAEFDTVDALIARPNGIFRGMAHAAGVINSSGLRQGSSISDQVSDTEA
eukprot:m.790864 g.790864  ORF g.790864 m.790864 type:complete len:1581 (+) comp23327_c0_seq3:295-5037(+)